jgi:hypothetical protein
VFRYSCVAAGFFNGERLAPDEADSASPELQRIDALPSHVTSAEQDCGGAYQNCECHHLSSLFESSLVLVVCFSKIDAL